MGVCSLAVIVSCSLPMPPLSPYLDLARQLACLQIWVVFLEKHLKQTSLFLFPEIVQAILMGICP